MKVPKNICNTRQHTATHGNTRHYIAIQCDTLICTFNTRGGFFDFDSTFHEGAKQRAPQQAACHKTLCCSVLQCVAVRCSVLQCVAVCSSALQCVAVCCSVLQCVAVCCSVLQCVAFTQQSTRDIMLVWCYLIAVCSSVLQCIAMCCSALCFSQQITRENKITNCSLLQHVAMCCNLLQCVESPNRIRERTCSIECKKTPLDRKQTRHETPWSLSTNKRKKMRCSVFQLFRQKQCVAEWRNVLQFLEQKQCKTHPATNGIKESCKRGIQQRPIQESYKKVIQKRPVKESYKRVKQKRPSSAASDKRDL